MRKQKVYIFQIATFLKTGVYIYIYIYIYVCVGSLQVDFRVEQCSIR